MKYFIKFYLVFIYFIILLTTSISLKYHNLCQGVLNAVKHRINHHLKALKIERMLFCTTHHAFLPYVNHKIYIIYYHYFERLYNRRSEFSRPNKMLVSFQNIYSRYWWKKEKDLNCI